METRKKHDLRIKRHKRLRKKVHGTADRPRLTIFKSSRHFYAQIINDDLAHTLVSASTLEPEMRSSLKQTGNGDAVLKVGELIAKKAKKAKITQVVFDHGGFGYKGKIKQFADKTREQGLVF
ncbi:MAG: 50S ribosomal protein L18 [bacterium]